VVLDRHEVVERRLGQPGIVERRNLLVEQIAEQAGGERRLVADQRNHTLMNQ